MYTIEASPEYARIVAKSWINPKFRERLLADPAAVLGEHGIDVPADLRLSVGPGASTSRLELALPSMPMDLTDESLGRHAGPPKNTQGGGNAPESMTKPCKPADDAAPGHTRQCKDDEPAGTCRSSTRADGGDAVPTEPGKAYDTAAFTSATKGADAPPKLTRGQDVASSTRACHAGHSLPASA
jgi:hypothetical protein